MAPTRQRSRHSDQSTASAKSRDDATGGSKVPLKGSPSTPRHRSPVRRPRRGISLLQKQALIDNLQLEITERARRLRAQYHLQAQGLRSRIEIRVNRIPTSLRKVKMGDLILKCLEQERNRSADGRPPPLLAKEAPRLAPQKLAYGASRSQAPERNYRTAHGEVAGDKENEMENSKGERKARHQVADAGSTRPVQVLSPTSSNSRLATRDRPASPTKSHIARPGSPLKSHGVSRSAAVTSVLSSMVERAKAARHGGTRKVTATSESSSSGTTTATRGRRPAAAAASKAPPPSTRPITRAGHRASGTSETSEGSTGTVVRKPIAAAAAATKKTTMGAIRKGVAGGGAKKTAAKAAAPKPPKTGGRVLRKRG
ncbi:Borealin-lik [Hirsutella rhossiliensis]|uniref:Borealin-lik n=1 Tax=Hirsutella rhossiliensis TaxID=111463 RepID=A0A9P8MQR4_9HYPO|nr:Borealin-lik [Hirsutella rhossiliensis]KAH0957507.1 Borealin-lik [Hirsutella rhossiliensis]